MKKWFLVITLVTILAISLVQSNSFAHQSGCHRWHSCPSDSGSYTCGDTGYCSQCSDNQYCNAGKQKVTSIEAVSGQTSSPSSTKTTSPPSTQSTYTSTTEKSGLTSLASQNARLLFENNELKNEIQYLKSEIEKLKQEINKINELILKPAPITEEFESKQESKTKEEKTCFLMWCW